MNPTLMKFVEWLLCRNIHFTVTSAFRTEEQNDAYESNINEIR
nr:MAG TPA: endopeptidase [Microviridae sp.]